MPLWTLKRNKKFNSSKKMRGERRALCFKTVPNQHSSKAHCVRTALGLLGLHRGMALSQLPHPSPHRWFRGALYVTLQVCGLTGKQMGTLSC